MSTHDAAAREAIRNDLDVTMLVEAAAGTGKTTNLVRRMTNLVDSARADAGTVAAITFTVKAAAQLRERFRRDAGFIGTTHAFCGRLLRERPVEAGLDPEFEELDEAAAKTLTADFWNRWFDGKALTGDPIIAEARSVGLDRQTLRGAFSRIVEYPDVTLVSVRCERPELSAVVTDLVAFLRRVEPHLPTDEHRDEPDAFEKLMVKLLRQWRRSDLTDPFEQFALLDEANYPKRQPVQKRWPDKATAKQLGIDYSALATNRIGPAVRAWREYVHGIALELLRPAAEEFAKERRLNGTLTFQDLLVCARDMLRDHPNVRRYFQRRFTHVFVDEFQDTDPLQAEVLFYLTGIEVEERNWRNLTPRPGSLFIVGDPKQSIYRFRRADITTYLAVRDRILATGGVVVRLSASFRSSETICAYVNDAFAALFEEGDVLAGRQAAHVELESAGEAAGTPQRPAVSAVFGLETNDEKSDERACAEATVVGEWIRQQVDAGSIRYQDVLLISWQTPRLSCYAGVFESKGIPYEITGSRAFRGMTDLAHVMPLLRAIVTPEDEVQVVAYLRGPLCGIDDDTLYRYRQGGGSLSPFKGELPALRTIREAIDDARQHPPAAAIARLFDRLGLIALSASGEHPGTRSGNLMLALSIARDLSARGEPLAAIVEHLDALLENPPDIEELDADPARTDAVRMMNLHQVKGLEAPVVFLIDPTDEYDFEIDLFVDRRGEESIGHLALSREWGRGRKDIALPPKWDELQALEKQFKDAEKKRLLYVAATRAQRMLVVGYRMASGRIKGAWRDLASRVRTPFPSVSSVSSVVKAFHHREHREHREEAWERARTATYSVLPITKIAHESHQDLVKAEEGLGKGMSWGRVLHRLFEAMLRDESLDIRFYASNLLKDEERDAADLEEVMRVVEAVQASALWQRVKKADERYVEIPFALTADIEPHGETLLHGTIDLVFREGERWFIVDYKSDSTVGRLEQLVAYYKPQVEHYARFWSSLTGAPASAGLFFVDGLHERWI